MERPADFDIETLIEQLRGTCKPIYELLPEGMDEDDLTGEELQRIDEEIFRCGTCDWWYELSDQSDDGENCEDCSEQEEE